MVSNKNKPEITFSEMLSYIKKEMWNVQPDLKIIMKKDIKTIKFWVRRVEISKGYFRKTRKKVKNEEKKFAALL